jgi:hypothetical protein
MPLLRRTADARRAVRVEYPPTSHLQEMRQDHLGRLRSARQEGAGRGPSRSRALSAWRRSADHAELDQGPDEAACQGRAAHPERALAIRIDQAVRDRIVPEVLESWVGLDEAAEILGLARQTVLHKVQRGDLAAVHVNRGRRKGLRINVRPARLDCSTSPDERHAQC